MAPGEEVDSGMESQENSVQDSPRDGRVPNFAPGTSNTREFSPDNKPAIEDSYSDEPDETVSERLWGLTEMFPESVRNVSHNVAITTSSTVKAAYSFSRTAFWIFFTSSLILFAPVIFEVERAQIEEAQRSQQKQMLLGPSTSMSSSAGVPMLPAMQR